MFLLPMCNEHSKILFNEPDSKKETQEILTRKKNVTRKRNIAASVIGNVRENKAIE